MPRKTVRMAVAKRGGTPAPANVQATPSAQDIQRIARVVRVASLARVELFEVKISRPTVLPTGSQVEVEIDVAHRNGLQPDGLVVQLKFTLATKPGTVEAEAVYSAYYDLSSAISEADAGVFAKHNAVFNVWPYFRELVQNFSARMGVPPLTIPLLKR